MSTTLTLDIEAKAGKEGSGKFITFVDLATDDNSDAIVHIDLPSPYVSIKGLAVYAVAESNGSVTKSRQKKRDMKALRGRNPDYAAIFKDKTPGGFSIGPGDKSIVISNDPDVPDVGFFEYLLWIEDEDGNKNFVDPGLRNRGRGSGTGG